MCVHMCVRVHVCVCMCVCVVCTYVNRIILEYLTYTVFNVFKRARCVCVRVCVHARTHVRVVCTYVNVHVFYFDHCCYVLQVK